MSWKLSDLPNNDFCAALDRYLTEPPEYDEECEEECEEYDDYWEEE